MKIKVKFLGPLKTALGKNEFTVELDKDGTLEALIIYLKKTIPGFSEAALKSYEMNDLRPEILVLINDREVFDRKRLNEVILKENDIITFIPMVHGGTIEFCLNRKNLNSFNDLCLNCKKV